MSQANADYPNTIYSTEWQMNNFREITRVIGTIHNIKKKGFHTHDYNFKSCNDTYNILPYTSPALQ